MFWLGLQARDDGYLYESSKMGFKYSRHRHYGNYTAGMPICMWGFFKGLNGVWTMLSSSTVALHFLGNTVYMQMQMFTYTRTPRAAIVLPE